MSFGTAILLGIIQGVAEFLPISSSGHLSVLQNVFHMQTAENGHLLFDALLHLGTLLSIVAAYWQDLRDIVHDTMHFLSDVRYGNAPPKRGYPGGRLLLMMFFATLPLFVAYPFKDQLESLYYRTGFIGAAFLLTGSMLYVSDRLPRGKKNEKNMTLLDAVIIGFCQAVAIIPGISRSGSTITAGIATGHDRNFAVKFSLLLSLPAVIGANILSMADALKSNIDTSLLGPYFAGTLTSCVAGYFSIIFLRRIMSSGKFGRFAYYMWAVGALTLLVSIFT